MFVHGIFIVFYLIINGLCMQAATLRNRWKTNAIADLNSPRAYCLSSTAQIGDDTAIYIGGAAQEDWWTGQFSASIHRYNASAKSFEEYNVTLPSGRIAPTVLPMGGKVYIIGGGVQGVTDGDQYDYLTDIYEFDPIKSTLEQITVVGPDAPIGMIYGAAAEINDDEFVLFSGEGPPGEVTSFDIWSFNLKSKQWTVRTPMPRIGMRSGAAVTLYHHFGLGKHGVFFLGGSVGDISFQLRELDNNAWILNPETWDLQKLNTDGNSGGLPPGEFHKLATEKIPDGTGTRVWAFGAEHNSRTSYQERSNSLQFLDILDGTDGSSPPIYWQKLPIWNPNGIRGVSFPAYMLHRRAGMPAEVHMLGGCYMDDFGTTFSDKTYSIARDDPGVNGAKSLLSYYVVNFETDIIFEEDIDTIFSVAGSWIQFFVTARDNNGESLNYGKDTLKSYLTHDETQELFFCHIVDLENGRYQFFYYLTLAGTYTLEIRLNGQLVNTREIFSDGQMVNARAPEGASVIITVVPAIPVAKFSAVFGDGLTSPTAGTWSRFTVQILDTYNNTIANDHAESVNASVTILPNFNLRDGSAPSPLNYTSEISDAGIEIAYQANITGSYRISAFIGDQMIGSSIDVDVVRDPFVNLDPPAMMRYNLDSPEAFATGVLLIFTAVGVILCAACTIGILMYRKENIIKAIDITASLTCLSGLMLLFISGLFWISEPTSATCGMWPFFVSAGLGIVLSTLARKIWNVYRIFTSKVKRKVSKWNSILVQGPIVLTDIIICAGWAAVDPPVPTIKYPDTYFSHHDCSSSSPERQKRFVAIIVSFNGLLVLSGLAVAYLARDLPSRYNQAAHIAVSMQSFIILAMFGLPVLFFIDEYLIAKTYLRFLIIWVPSMITTVLLFGLRVYVAFRTRKMQKSKGTAISTRESFYVKTASFVKYINIGTSNEMKGEVVKSHCLTVFWCQEHRLFPNIWLQSTMIVVPSIGILAFTDHEYGDAHMIIDSRDAIYETIPKNSEFEYMLRLCTRNGGAYLIGAFFQSDFAQMVPAIKTLVASKVDSFNLPEMVLPTNASESRGSALLSPK